MAKANRELMRAINRFAILNSIRVAGSISRIDIARKTGLSQATITGITADLIEEGMILELQGEVSGGGRRPIPLAINPQGAYTVGVHLSVDQVCIALMDLQASIIESRTEPLENGDFRLESVVEKLVGAVHACLWKADYSKKQLSGIGIAVPGLIDSRSGFVHYVPNYEWRNIGLADLLTRRFEVSCYVENSANTLAIYEQWFGLGRGTDNFALVTTEHGIGLGMVVNGQLYRGFRGGAGEFGHNIVCEDGPLCRCGARGCLEAISGNNAIVRDAREVARQGGWRVDDSEAIVIDDVIAAARDGNAPLRAIYRRAGRALGLGISNLQKIIDVEKIIISGKGVLARELLFGPMQETLAGDISFEAGAATRLYVQAWQPTHYARGAGALVLQEVYQSPANRVVPLL